MSKPTLDNTLSQCQNEWKTKKQLAAKCRGGAEDDICVSQIGENCHMLFTKYRSEKYLTS